MITQVENELEIIDEIQEELIYTDMCSVSMEQTVKAQLGVSIVKRFPDNLWTVSDTMRIITDPRIVLAVINRLDSISLMEISLLHFLCKPILVTTNSVGSYPAVTRTVDFVDEQCSFTNMNGAHFIQWFKLWKEERWN